MNNSKAERHLVVKNVQDLSPNMRRITLTGDDLIGFSDGASGGYVKLKFGTPEQPIVRTYTIAEQRVEAHEVDIDFMLHGDHGAASSWANKVQIGAALTMMGRGPRKNMDLTADWFFIVGDMTALPALSLNMRELPSNAKGVAYIEVLSEQDIRPIDKPDGLVIKWVINSSPGSDDTPLAVEAIAGDWLEGLPSTWVACEFKTMKKIRHYLKKQRLVDRSHVYTSSYWKKGLSEEEHKVAKRQDVDMFEARSLR